MCDQYGRGAHREVIEFDATHHHHGKQAKEKHQRANQTEKVHRFFAEFGLKPQREQIEVAVHKSVETEFGHAIFACLVLHHAFADFGVAGIFCQVGNVAVHIAIHLNVLHHLQAICLQAAVEVVQIVDAAHLACRGVEEFGRDGFGFGVVAFFLPSAHQIVALVHNHFVEVWNLVGAVLQVSVHGNHHIALHAFKAGVQRRRFAIIASEAHALNVGVVLMQLLNHLPRIVGAAIINHQHLIGKVVFLHHPLNPLCQFRQRFSFII